MSGMTGSVTMADDGYNGLTVAPIDKKGIIR